MDESLDDLLTRYAPTSASLRSEWDGTRSRTTFAAIVDEPERTAVYDLIRATRSSRRGRFPRGVAAAASAALLAAAAAVIVAYVAPGGNDSNIASGGGFGPAFDPPGGLSNSSIDDGHYSYRVARQLQLDDNGTQMPDAQNAMVSHDWVATDGATVSFRTGSQNGCFSFGPPGSSSFGLTTKQFLASLPTDVDQLNHYLREHVEGSSSLNEAVFVAVEETLYSVDGLASPRLRAAMVAVLSRTPGVTIHHDDTDYLGRPAVRADFVDQRIRPNDIQSLYFDPSTFQLIELRDGPDGQSPTFDGPTPAYDSAAQPVAVPDHLTGAGSVIVMTDEKVVDHLPSVPSDCQH